MAVSLPRPLQLGFQAHFRDLERRWAAGERRVGWKIAFSTPAAKRATGQTQALAAGLTSVSARERHEGFSVSGRTQLIVESELAVFLTRDLQAGANALEITRAIGEHAAAIELTDSDRPMTQLPEIIAQGVFHQALYLGPRVANPDKLDFRGLHAEVLRDGIRFDRVDVVQATGDPVQIISGLLDVLGPFGHGLLAGDLVILGCMVAIVDPKPGEQVELRLQTGSNVSCALE